MDLSAPQGKSVNDGISKDLCSLSHMTIDEGVVRNGRGAFMAKFDLKSAYCQVSVHPDDRWLLNGRGRFMWIAPFPLASVQLP